MSSTSSEQYMQRAIALAKKGNGHVSPNPCVGAVIVYEDTIIGEGYHQVYGQAHAEVNAVNAVKEEHKKLLQKATIYVTLEPCCHYGKTPPCADLILQTGIPKVVIGCKDPFPRVNGGGIQRLMKAGVEVTVGTLEKECLELIHPFIVNQTEKRPYIILKWAQSADGFIGKEGERTAISNPLALQLAHQWRSEADAVMVGSQTARIDNPRLSNRLAEGKQPIRVVVDRKGTLPDGLHLWDDTQSTLVITEATDHYAERPVTILPHTFSADNFPLILEQLLSLNIGILLVEGGAVLHQFFYESGFWDEMRVIEAPLQLGSGIKAIPPKGILITEESLADNILRVYKKAERNM